MKISQETIKNEKRNIFRSNLVKELSIYLIYNHNSHPQFQIRQTKFYSLKTETHDKNLTKST